MQSEVQPADLEELRAALIEFLDFLQAHSRRSPHFQRYIQQMLKSTDQCIRNGGHGMEEFNRHLLHDWQAANHAQTGIPSWAIWVDDPQLCTLLNAQFQEKVMNLERFFS